LLDVQETARKKLRVVSLVMGILSVGALFGVYNSSLEATYEQEIDGLLSEHVGVRSLVNDVEGVIAVGSTQALGQELFSSINGFILPFEIVSILLLVAMIGVILLSKKESK